MKMSLYAKKEHGNKDIKIGKVKKNENIYKEYAG